MAVSRLARIRVPQNHVSLHGFTTCPGPSRALAAAFSTAPAARLPVKPRRQWIRVGLQGMFLMSLALFISMPDLADIRTLTEPSSSRDDSAYEIDPDIREVEDAINKHPLTLELRKNPNLVEGRPHVGISPRVRAGHLTAGTLLGPGRVPVPPYVWTDANGQELVSILYLGADLCGHPGIIHGGFLATILDEGLARCCFPALPAKVGVTASLNINYRSPAAAGSLVVLRATTTKVDGRKGWVEGRIETLPQHGEAPRVIADATALFISVNSPVTIFKGLMPA